jgi:hypothetical protein
MSAFVKRRGSQIYALLGQAKKASGLTDTRSSEDKVPLRVCDKERAGAARRLVKSRMAYVEHKSMCPICLVHD